MPAPSDPEAPPDPDESAWARPEELAEPATDDGGPAATLPAQAQPELPDEHGADGVIRAGGGVVWSRWGSLGVQIVLVHRPRYDDWTLPKGKANPGESDASCALREVREETGLSCSLGEELVPTSYLDNKGRAKTVRYWAMKPIGGFFAPNNEVDEVRWTPLPEAVRLLTYERDVKVLASFTPPGDVPQAT